MALHLFALPALAATAMGQTVTRWGEDCYHRLESDCTCFVANRRGFFDDCLLRRSTPATRFLRRPIFLDGDQCESRGFRPLQGDHGACFGGSGARFNFFVTDEDEFWRSVGPSQDNDCGQCLTDYDENRYDDRYDDNRYDRNRYDRDRYNDRYDENRYDRNRYDRNRYDENRYDRNRYDEHNYGDNRIDGYDDYRHDEIQV